MTLPPLQPRLLVFFGMTASGKSTLAMAWSDHDGAPYYNTDRVRKELAGLQATDRRPDDIGQGIYSPALTTRTYQTMLDQAQRDFTKGASLVVLDGSYSQRADRDAVRSLAGRIGVQSIFLYCFCSETETRRRLACRAIDAQAVSDGRWEIYLHQQRSFELPGREEQDCIRVHTERPVPELLNELHTQPSLLGLRR